MTSYNAGRELANACDPKAHPQKNIDDGISQNQYKKIPKAFALGIFIWKDL